MVTKTYTLIYGEQFRCPNCNARKRLKRLSIDDYECHACLTIITVTPDAEYRTAAVVGTLPEGAVE